MIGFPQSNPPVGIRFDKLTADILIDMNYFRIDTTNKLLSQFQIYTLSSERPPSAPNYLQDLRFNDWNIPFSDWDLTFNNNYQSFDNRNLSFNDYHLTFGDLY